MKAKVKVSKADFLDRILQDGVPLAISTYTNLLTDTDPKIRLQAANAIMEVAGFMGKAAQVDQPKQQILNVNLTPSQLEGIIHGFTQIAERPTERPLIRGDVVGDFPGSTTGVKG